MQSQQDVHYADASCQPLARTMTNVGQHAQPDGRVRFVSLRLAPEAPQEATASARVPDSPPPIRQVRRFNCNALTSIEIPMTVGFNSISLLAARASSAASQFG